MSVHKVFKSNQDNNKFKNKFHLIGFELNGRASGKSSVLPQPNLQQKSFLYEDRKNQY